MFDADMLPPIAETERMEPVDDLPDEEFPIHPLNESTLQISPGEDPFPISFEGREDSQCTIFQAVIDKNPDEETSVIVHYIDPNSEDQKEEELTVAVFAPVEGSPIEKDIEFMCTPDMKPSIQIKGSGTVIIHCQFDKIKVEDDEDDNDDEGKPTQSIELRCALLMHWINYRMQPGSPQMTRYTNIGKKTTGVAKRIGADIDYWADKKDCFKILDSFRTHMEEFGKQTEGLGPIFDHLLSMLPPRCNDSRTDEEEAVAAFLEGWDQILHAVEPSFITFLFQHSKCINNENRYKKCSDEVKEVLDRLINTEGVFEEHKRTFGNEYNNVDFDNFKEWEDYEEGDDDDEEPFEEEEDE